MNNTHNMDQLTQQGQAMSEFLLIFALFILLMTGIQMTASMQYSAIYALLDSTKKVFEFSVGLKAEHVKVNSLTESSSPSLLNLNIQVLTEELALAFPGFVRARTTATDKRWGKDAVWRQSFIEAGNGHAASDLNVQHQIGEAPTLWLKNYQATVQTIDPIKTLTYKNDDAWQRPKISVDYLERWSGVVPEQKRRLSHVWSK